MITTKQYCYDNLFGFLDFEPS